MKRIIILGAAAAALLVAGVALGLSLADGAGPASAQQADPQAAPAVGACGAGGSMLQHMQQMHDADDIEAMRDHMDDVHGQGSFDRMAGQCDGSSAGAGSQPSDSDGAGWPGGMMGGYADGGGMMGW